MRSSNTDPISSRSSRLNNRGCLIVFWLFFMFMGGAGCVASFASLAKTGFGIEALPALVPLVFLLIGLGGLVSTVRGRKQGSAALPKSSWQPPSPQRPSVVGQAVQSSVQASTGTTLNGPFSTSSPFASIPASTRGGTEYTTGYATSGPVVLRPAQSRIGALIGVTCVALFWNGIVSVFLWHLFTDPPSGGFKWFLGLFLIPFVLVGLSLIGGIIYCFLALFIPRSTLTVSSDTVLLGGSLDLQWQLSGGIVGVQRLRLTLEGREEATYRRGTDTYTDKSTFFNEDIFDTVSRSAMQSGSQQVIVPADLMHSFESQNNKIIWSLKVHGNIPLWPDISEEYKIIVLPHNALR